MELNNKLEISLYHLFILQNEITNFLGALEETIKLNKNRSTNETIIVAGILSICIIKANAIFEEINHYLNKELGNAGNNKLIEDIQNVRAIFDTLFPEVNKFRNEVLAHPFRDRSKQYESIHLSRRITDYDMPKTISELLEYLNKVVDLVSIIFLDYKNEYNKFHTVTLGFSR